MDIYIHISIIIIWIDFCIYYIDLWNDFHKYIHIELSSQELYMGSYSLYKYVYYYDNHKYKVVKNNFRNIINISQKIKYNQQNAYTMRCLYWIGAKLCSIFFSLFPFCPCLTVDWTSIYFSKNEYNNNDNHKLEIKYIYYFFFIFVIIYA